MPLHVSDREQKATKGQKDAIQTGLYEDQKDIFRFETCAGNSYVGRSSDGDDWGSRSVLNRRRVGPENGRARPGVWRS